MLSQIKDFHKLSEFELVKEVNQQLDRAKEEIFQDGVDNGFRVCISRMLESRAQPEFIAKIADVNIDFILEVKDELQK